MVFNYYQRQFLLIFETIFLLILHLWALSNVATGYFEQL